MYVFYEFRENITKSSFLHRYYGFYEWYENEHMGEEPLPDREPQFRKKHLRVGYEDPELNTHYKEDETCHLMHKDTFLKWEYFYLRVLKGMKMKVLVHELIHYCTIQVNKINILNFLLSFHIFLKYKRHN